MHKLRPYLIALGLIAFVMTGRAQSPYASAGIDDARQVDAFLSDLQRASREGDRQALAALIQYPTMVVIDGLRIPFADAAAVLERADAIFTPALRTMIARASAAGAPADAGRVPIRVTETGLLIGAAAIRIKMMGGRLRMTAIVVPPADPADLSAVPGMEGSARLQDPRRIALRVGLRPTQMAGSLVAGVPDRFVVWVNKGQRLEVRLERAPVGTAAVSVVHAVKGTLLNPGASDSARVVTGRALDGAEYRIEVRRLGAGEATPLPYMLAVSVR